MTTRDSSRRPSWRPVSTAAQLGRKLYPPKKAFTYCRAGCYKNRMRDKRMGRAFREGEPPVDTKMGRLMVAERFRFALGIHLFICFLIN